MRAKAWKGWLYSGGSAHVCRTPAQLAAALVTSMDPCIVKKKNGGTESEELQELQLRLLGAIESDWRAALYPAAICTLADLRDVRPSPPPPRSPSLMVHPELGPNVILTL